jgi:hypothetical protein
MMGLMLDLNLELYDDQIVGNPRDRTEGWSAFATIFSILRSGMFKSLPTLDVRLVDVKPKETPLTQGEKVKLDRTLLMFNQLFLKLGPSLKKLQVHITCPHYNAARDCAKIENDFIEERRAPRASRFWHSMRASTSAECEDSSSGYWIFQGRPEPSSLWEPIGF